MDDRNGYTRLEEAIVVDECNGPASIRVELEKSASSSCCHSRAMRFCCIGLFVVSIIGNVVLAAVTVLIIENNESAYSPLPPPTPNGTFGNCTVNSTHPVDMFDLGSDFFGVCWDDFAVYERPYYYQVLMDDYWMDNGKPDVPVYRGRDVFLNITGLLPSTNYTIRVTSSENTKGFELKVKTHPRGYCGNDQDVIAYKKTKKTMKHDIQRCMIGHITKSDDAIQDCISDVVGLSGPCARCWVAEAHCTIKYCFHRCLNPESDDCKDCSEEFCFPDAVKCSGMPRWSFPA